jgi:hypothetical protein
MMKTINMKFEQWKNKSRKYISYLNQGLEGKSKGALFALLFLLFGMNCKYDFVQRFVPPTDLFPAAPAATTFKIGGSAADANATGLVLQNNGEDDLEVTPGAVFTFAKAIPAGSTYNVTVKTLPPLVTTTSGACNISGGTGTANADVTDVSIECSCGSAVTYPWGTFKDRCNGTVEFKGVAGTFGGSEYEAQTIYYAKCSQGQTWNSTTNACDATASTIAYCGAADNSCNGGSTAGSLTSSAAYGSCNTLNTTPSNGFGTRTGWRVPTRNELKLLTLCTGGTTIPNNGASCAASANPAIDGLFPSTPASAAYWSSNSSTATNAWSVSFTDGNTTAVSKTTASRIRCVTNASNAYPAVVGRFRSIVSTPSGDAVYAAGYFEGIGTYSYGNNVSVTGLHATNNPVVVKYNSSGVAQWAKTFTSVPTNGNAGFYSVALDSSGNVYVVGNTGTAAGTYSFGNSISINALGAAFSAIMIKYDSNGTPLLAESPTGSTGGSYWRAVTVSGNDVYAAGGLAGGTPFVYGGYTVTGQNTGGTGVVIKYNASNFTASLGQLATNGGIGCCNYNGVAVDPSGNVYLTGMISISTVDFGNGLPTLTGDVVNDSGMVIKLNSAFVAQWAKNFFYQTYGVAVDSSGNVYVTTRAHNSARDFSGINYTGTSAANNAVLVKLNGTNGNGIWLRGNSTVTETGFAYADFYSKISIDSSDNIYVPGYAATVGNVNFGSGVVTGASGGWNALLVRYDTSGNNISTTIQSTATNSSMAAGIFIDSSGVVYISGFGTESIKYTVGTKTFSGKGTGENPAWWK